MVQRFVCLAALALLVGCNRQPPAGTSAANQPATETAMLDSRQPENQPAQKPSALKAPQAAEARPVTLPAGTRIRVRLADSLSTQRNRAGDRFTATLDAPIAVGDRVVIPKGTPFNGHVTAASPSGRLEGRAVLGVTLDSFELGGNTYHIDTSAASRASSAHKKRNLVLIGGGSGLGAALGAVAGGGTGALIGAAAGAAAGTGGAAATGKKNVALPVETPLTFSLRAPVSIQAG